MLPPAHAESLAWYVPEDSEGHKYDALCTARCYYLVFQYQGVVWPSINLIMIAAKSGGCIGTNKTMNQSLPPSTLFYEAYAIVLLQCGGLKSQASPPRVRQWETPPVSWWSPQAYEVLRKDKQRDALDRAKARFDSHQQASVGGALQDRGKPQQDSSVGDDLQDTRHSRKRLAEDIQMQDVLRRLQMLELEHIKVLGSILV